MNKNRFKQKYKKYIDKIISEYSIIDSMDTINQNIINNIKQISEVNMVMLYKFDENYDGNIIAQQSSDINCKDKTNEDFMENHIFKSSTLSKEKQLFLENRVRFISCGTLENRYTMSLSIIVDSRLWGLVLACYLEKKSLHSYEYEIYDSLSKIVSHQIQQKELVNLNERLKIQAVTDPLTLLYNLRYFKEFGILQFDRSLKTQESFSVLLLDISNLEEIKNHYGNEVCDFIIISIKNRIELQVPQKSAILSRISCYEFAMIIYDNDLDINIVANNILEDIISKEFIIDKANIFIQAFISVVKFDKELFQNFSQMLRASELKLQMARQEDKRVYNE
ncbi:MAG: GGDEF domain-containing protein [Campylobacterota bacterium]